MARDVFNVPQARPADFGSFSGVARPAGAGKIWSAGVAGSSAILLLSR